MKLPRCFWWRTGRMGVGTKSSSSSEGHWYACAACTDACTSNNTIRPTQARENFLRELKTMVVMRHPHIIKLREAFLTQDHLAIVMEVLQESTSQKLFHQYHHSTPAWGTCSPMSPTSSTQTAPPAGSRKRTRSGFSSRPSSHSTTCTCWYDAWCDWPCHVSRQGFSSRDFKLENCGLVPGRMAERPLLKLMDFASSKVPTSVGAHLPQPVDTQDTRDNSPAQTLVGSTPYIAPEMMFPPYDAQARRRAYDT